MSGANKAVSPAATAIIAKKADKPAEPASDIKAVIPASKVELELAKLHQAKQALLDSKKTSFSDILLGAIAENRYKEPELNLSEQKLDEVAATALAKALTMNTHIKKLNLAKTQLDDKGMQALINQNAFKHLQALNVSHNNITAAGIKGIENERSFDVLLINNNPLNPEGAACIAKNNYIRLLNIARCNIQGPGVKAFFEKEKSVLMSLDASYNGVQMHGANDNASPTALCASLCDIKLGGTVANTRCRVDATQAQQGFMVHPNIYLKDPYDAINFITLRLLSMSQSLVSLDLSECEFKGAVPFTPETCTAFVKSPITFANATSLRTVNISKVHAPRADKWLFIADLAKIPGLTVLKAVDVCHNYDTSTSSKSDDEQKAEQVNRKAMVKNLIASRSLTEVDISNNELGAHSHGYYTVAELGFDEYQTNTVICKLNLAGNEFNEKDVNRIYSFVERNKQRMAGASSTSKEAPSSGHRNMLFSSSSETAPSATAAAADPAVTASPSSSPVN